MVKEGPTADDSANAASGGREQTRGQRSDKSEPHIVTRICAGLAVVLLVGLFLSRSFAQQFDFSIANILTLVMGFFAWLSLVAALAFSRLSRWYWRFVAFAPVVLIAVGLSMYRVVGIDGELVPQFQSRWQRETALPAQVQSEVIPAAALSARPTDFPQFLGPARDGIVRGLQLQTDWKAHPPQIVWKQSIGDGWSSFAIQGDVAVTLEQRDKEQWVSAYDVNTGKLYWYAAVPGSHFNPLGGAGPRSTPTIVGDKVYAQLVTGPIICLELATGKKLWEVDLIKLTGWDQTSAEKVVAWGRSGSPLVIDQSVVVPLGGLKSEDGSLVALHVDDGRVLWRAGYDEQISYSSPVRATLLGVDQIVMVNERSITGHAISSGQVLWKLPWEGSSSGAANVSQPLPVDDEQLLITKGYSQGAQLVKFSKSSEGEWSSEVVWRKSSVLKTKFTSAVLSGDYAYGLSDGTLECVRVSDGTRQWKNGRYHQGQLLLVGNVLLITAEDGSVVLVAAEPTKFAELARVPVIEGVTWNVPSLSGDRLLVRNADEAACLRLPLVGK